MVDLKVDKIYNGPNTPTTGSKLSIATSADSSVFDAAKTPDGKVGNFEQGGIGDCWFLSTLFANGSTKEGAKLIKESIETLPNGNFRVTFKGDPNKPIIVKAAEIFDPANDKLSTGDIDVKIFEIAAIEYFADKPDKKDAMEKGATPTTAHKLLAGKSFGYIRFKGITSTEEAVKKSIQGKEAPSNYVELNNVPVTTTDYDLFPSKSNFDRFNPSPLKPKEIEFLNKAAQNPEKYAITAIAKDDVFEEGEIVTFHAYAIKAIDPKTETLTIVNPHDTSKPFVMSYFDFSVKFDYIAFNELQV